MVVITYYNMIIEIIPAPPRRSVNEYTRVVVRYWGQGLGPARKLPGL